MRESESESDQCKFDMQRSLGFWRVTNLLWYMTYWSKMTLNYWMMVETYPNLKKEVGGSIPGCEISSLLDRDLALACRHSVSNKKNIIHDLPYYLLRWMGSWTVTFSDWKPTSPRISDVQFIWDGCKIYIGVVAIFLMIFGARTDVFGWVSMYTAHSLDSRK